MSKVPAGWENQELGLIAKVVDCKHRTPVYVENGIPLVSPGTIKWGPLDLVIPNKRVSEEEYKSLMDHCDVEINDLVLSRNQSVGVVSYVSCNNPFVLGQDTVLIKPKDVNKKFLFFKFQSKDTQKEITKLAGGSTFSRINLSDIRKLRFSFPPLPEQTKIAQILSTWDKAITTTEQLIGNSQQQKKSLMQSLLTGKRRVPKFNDAWLWVKANELFETRTQRNNSELEELLSVTQDRGVLPRSLLERRVVMPEGTTLGYKLVEAGDFIISLRSFQGGLEYSNYRGLVSPAYTVLKPINTISSDFYRHYFKSYDFIGHLAVAVIGIRDGKQISYSDFSFLKLPFPPLPEQQKIAAVLTAADNEIELLQKKLAFLKQEKAALMQQLLTGKRRVKVETA